MGDGLNKLVDDTASGKEPLPPGVTRMHLPAKFPNEWIDHEYVRKIVREELTKILTDIERYPESQPLYDTIQDKCEGNVSGHRHLPENQAINMLVRDLLETIKKEK